MDTVFSVVEEEVQGTSVLSARGEIDVATAPELRRYLHARADAGRTVVVMDLSQASFLDSTGLGVLVGANKRLHESGGELRLVVTEPRILKVFEITGLHEVFAIYDDIDLAVHG
jgi:anti-sigma B factor antagonist